MPGGCTDSTSFNLESTSSFHVPRRCHRIPTDHWGGVIKATWFSLDSKAMMFPLRPKKNIVEQVILFHWLIMDKYGESYLIKNMMFFVFRIWDAFLVWWTPSWSIEYCWDVSSISIRAQLCSHPAQLSSQKFALRVQFQRCEGLVEHSLAGLGIPNMLEKLFWHPMVWGWVPAPGGGQTRASLGSMLVDRFTCPELSKTHCNRDTTIGLPLSIVQPGVGRTAWKNCCKASPFQRSNGIHHAKQQRKCGTLNCIELHWTASIHAVIRLDWNSVSWITEFVRWYPQSLRAKVLATINGSTKVASAWTSNMIQWSQPWNHHYVTSLQEHVELSMNEGVTNRPKMVCFNEETTIV